MLMNKYKHRTISTRLLTILLIGLGGPVYAESETSYSPDYWPSRWGSAIRHQKSGKYPTRQIEQEPLADLPEAVSEQDLFFSPHQGKKFDTRGKSYSNPRFSRNPSRHNRDSAYAYPNNAGASNKSNQQMPAMDPALGNPGNGIPMMPGVPGGLPFAGVPYGGTPFGGTPYGGYPYGGIPYGGSPYGGSPYGGYPYGGMPFGFPGGKMGMWSMPFGSF